MHFLRDSGVSLVLIRSCIIIIYSHPARQTSLLIAMDGMYAGFAGAKNRLLPWMACMPDLQEQKPASYKSLLYEALLNSNKPARKLNIVILWLDHGMQK